MRLYVCLFSIGSKTADTMFPKIPHVKFQEGKARSVQRKYKLLYIWRSVSVKGSKFGTVSLVINILLRPNHDAIKLKDF